MLTVREEEHGEARDRVSKRGSGWGVVTVQGGGGGNGWMRCRKVHDVVVVQKATRRDVMWKRGDSSATTSDGR